MLSRSLQLLVVRKIVQYINFSFSMIPCFWPSGCCVTRHFNFGLYSKRTSVPGSFVWICLALCCPCATKDTSWDGKRNYRLVFGLILRTAYAANLILRLPLSGSGLSKVSPNKLYCLVLISLEFVSCFHANTFLVYLNNVWVGLCHRKSAFLQPVKYFQLLLL